MSSFASWSSADIQTWINSVALPSNAKTVLCKAVEDYGVTGYLILGCETEEHFKHLLGIETVIIRQLMVKLKTCDAYNNAKQTEGQSTPNKEDEEAKERERQRQRANQSSTHFNANNCNNNNNSNGNNNNDDDGFFPTFCFAAGEQKTDIVKIYSHWTLGRLFEHIRDHFMGNENKKLSKIDIYYKTLLLADEKKTLKEYGITNTRCILFTKIRVQGGSALPSTQKDKIRKVSKNNKEITITKAVDCITGEDSEKDPRALMPCGHAFTAITMFTYIQHSFDNFNNYEFVCPYSKCGKKWDWELVSMVADLTDDEFNKYSNILQKRQVSNGVIKCCPHCSTNIDKPAQLNQNRVRCVKCEGADFCYLCLKKWNHSGLQICGNEECMTFTIEDCVKNCKDTNITSNTQQVIPQMRACPKCLTIITYTDLCKHMKCAHKDCRYEFCFSCLLQWPCKTSICTPAPRQQL